jgi:hypothetical protein
MSDLVFPLRHGLLLTVDGEPTLRSVRKFLAAAAIHFKNQRDIQQQEHYTAGSFQGRLGDADGVISNPGDAMGAYLPPAAWADAVFDAHRRVSALETQRAEMASGMGARAGTFNDAILDLLSQPSPKSHLAALALATLTSWDDGDEPTGPGDAAVKPARGTVH